MNRIEQLLIFIKEDPQDYFSRYALALEYISIDKVADARLILEQLVTDHADYLPVYYQLGKLYESEKLNEKAIDLYRKGIDLALIQKNQHTLSELRSTLEDLEDC